MNPQPGHSVSPYLLEAGTFGHQRHIARANAVTATATVTPTVTHRRFLFRAPCPIRMWRAMAPHPPGLSPAGLTAARSGMPLAEPCGGEIVSRRGDSAAESVPSPIGNVDRPAVCAAWSSGAVSVAVRARGRRGGATLDGRWCWWPRLSCWAGADPPGAALCPSRSSVRPRSVLHLSSRVYACSVTCSESEKGFCGMLDRSLRKSAMLMAMRIRNMAMAATITIIIVPITISIMLLEFLSHR